MTGSRRLIENSSSGPANREVLYKVEYQYIFVCHFERVGE